MALNKTAVICSETPNTDLRIYEEKQLPLLFPRLQTALAVKREETETKVHSLVLRWDSIPWRPHIETEEISSFFKNVLAWLIFPLLLKFFWHFKEGNGTGIQKRKTKTFPLEHQYSSFKRRDKRGKDEMQILNMLVPIPHHWAAHQIIYTTLTATVMFWEGAIAMSCLIHRMEDYEKIKPQGRGSPGMRKLGSRPALQPWTNSSCLSLPNSIKSINYTNFIMSRVLNFLLIAINCFVTLKQEVLYTNISRDRLQCRFSLLQLLL